MNDRLRRPARHVAGAALVGLAVFVSLSASPAGAERATADEVRSLAERATSDPAALARLRTIDQVDGRPVDLRRALEGAQGEDLHARLHSLAPGAGDGVGTGGGATDPGAEARRILDGRKFKPAPVLRPFRGILERIGGWLQPVLDPLRRLWNRAADNTPGRMIIAVAVAGLAALVSGGLIRRSSAAGVGRSRGTRNRARLEDPSELEAQADAAERAGNLALAYRLRFRAGLVRLDRAGAIAYRPALTTGDLTRRVPSAHFRGLAEAFDEIAYGGRQAQPDDLQAARTTWPQVLEEVGRP